MSWDLDFEDPVVQGFTNGLAAQSDAVLCTVLLANATWPLTAGNVVNVEADFTGIDSNGVAFEAVLRGVIPHGLAANTVVLQTATTPIGYYVSCEQNTPTTGNFTFVPYGLINSGGDLELHLSNQNAPLSGITENCAVRVKVRRVGS